MLPISAGTRRGVSSEVVYCSNIAASLFLCSLQSHFLKEKPMGKYLIAWLLGVPAIVLVIIYFFLN